MAQTKNEILKKVSMISGIVLMAVLIIFLIFLSRNSFKEYDYIGRTAESKNIITISGQAEVIAVPDVAKVHFSVFNEAQTATEAQKQNTQESNLILAELKNLEINEKDLKTTGYNIYPQYDWTEDGRQFKGYKVSQSIQVTIREIDQANSVIAKLGELNVDEISNLSFEVDDLESVKQEAKILAIENAKQKAEELGKALDVKIGRIVNFSETSSQPLPKYDYARSEAIGLGAGEELPDIPVGESEIQANVTISFELL